MDSLFLMQRYWGSDEEETEDLLADENCNENSRTASKIQKSVSSTIEEIEIDSDIEELVELNNSDSVKNIYEKVGSCNAEVKSPKVKRKSNSENKSKKESSILSQTHTLSDSTITIEKSAKISPSSPKLKKTKKQKISEKTNSSKISVTEQVEHFTPIGQVQRPVDTKVKQPLPFWLSNPTYIGINLKDENTPISNLMYLDSNAKKNLEQARIKFLFPVQLAVIPWLMQSKERCLLVRPSDICVSAPTGSGKTLAFVLPIVQSLKDRVVCGIRALVVLPVNELAIQVFKVFETFTQGTDLKIALLTGQKSFLFEQKSLVKYVGQKAKSLVDIIVTTPGRVTDHMLRTRGFCLKQLRYLVIDEADRMMEEIQQGWLKQVEDAVFQDCHPSDCVCSGNKRIFNEPSSAYNFGLVSQPLQKLLYSATLTHDPEQLHSLSLYKPKLFTTSTQNADEDFVGTCTIPENLTTLQVVCETGIKPVALSYLIQKHQFKRVLCFTESVERAHRLHLVLEKMGMFQVREISSYNRPIQRKIALEQFALGKVNILVCSDLVARGMDIEDIDCVISYDVPHFAKIYIHRIGRTARAGKGGTAITLLSLGEIPLFKKILRSAGIKMPETYNIDNEALEAITASYKEALIAADTQLKQEKTTANYQIPQKWKKKIKTAK